MRGTVSKSVKVLGIVALAALSIGVGATKTAAVARPYEGPIQVTQATISSAEAAGTSPHQQFGVACPANTQPASFGDPNGGACQSGNGQLIFNVDPNTKYYFRSDSTGAACTSGQGCIYRPSTYETVVVQGGTALVGGKFAQDASTGTYKFLATYVWSPGDNVAAPPPNPAPAAIPADYDFTRRFVVDATVEYTGNDLIFNGVWSNPTGMILDHITDYHGSAHVQAIAAHHQNPNTGLPQLAVDVADVSPRSDGGILTGDGLTHFYLQGPDLVYRKATKDQVVQAGASVYVGGSYAWTADGDWRFVGSYVWRPAPSNQNGRIMFNETARRTSYSQTSDQSWSASYAGTVTGSNGANLGGSPITVTTNWNWDGVRNIWVITGNWAVNQNGGAGSIAGTMSAEWDPGRKSLPWYNIAGTTVLTQTTGQYCGETGGGSFAGQNSPDPSNRSASPGAPTPTFDGAFNISISRSPC